MWLPPELWHPWLVGLSWLYLKGRDKLHFHRYIEHFDIKANKSSRRLLDTFCNYLIILSSYLQCQIMNKYCTLRPSMIDCRFLVSAVIIFVLCSKQQLHDMLKNATMTRIRKEILISQNCNASKIYPSYMLSHNSPYCSSVSPFLLYYALHDDSNIKFMKKSRV